MTGWSKFPFPEKQRRCKASQCVEDDSKDQMLSHLPSLNRVNLQQINNLMEENIFSLENEKEQKEAIFVAYKQLAMNFS